jgi:protein phosphatase
LLCSDGLSGLVSDQEIGSLLANLPPNEASQVLVDLANLRGGPDNITCIIVHIKHPSLATSGSEQTPPAKTGPSPPISNLWLPITLAVAAAIMVWLYWYVRWQWAIALALIAGACLLWVLFQRIGNAAGASRGRAPLRLGRGPYTQLACASGKDVTNQLREITLQLKKGAENENWNINMEALNAQLQKAELASQNGASSDAVRAYARCISFMMDQLRNQQS